MNLPTKFFKFLNVFLFLQIFKPQAELLQKICFQWALFFFFFFAAISLKRCFLTIPTFQKSVYARWICVTLTVCMLSMKNTTQLKCLSPLFVQLFRRHGAYYVSSIFKIMWSVYVCDVHASINMNSSPGSHLKCSEMLYCCISH